MLPLILNIVLLPVIAFAMTQYVLLPRLNQSAVAPGAAQGDHGDEASQDDASHGASASHDTGHSAPAKSDSHGSDSKGHGSSSDATHMLDAVTVNVAGTMGSRLLMAKIGIRGTNPKLEDLVKTGDMICGMQRLPCFTPKPWWTSSAKGPEPRSKRN